MAKSSKQTRATTKPVPAPATEKQAQPNRYLRAARMIIKKVSVSILWHWGWLRTCQPRQRRTA